MTTNHDDLLGFTARAPSCAHNGGYGTSASCPKCVAALAQVVPPTPPAAPATAGDPFAEMSMSDVIGFCRANGIRKLRYKGVEVEFAENPTPAAASTPEAFQKFAEAMAGSVPSDTDFLGWSATNPAEFQSDLAQLAEALGLSEKE